ncbi:hypothetical protein QZH41_018520 [Actinostola sp. cb2023]|nr:hypothetical protein QZH41_018520 [Actinostola sp. cb2023]
MDWALVSNYNVRYMRFAFLHQELLEHLSSFLSGCGGSKTSQSMNNIDKIQCAIVLLQSLPCARHAVLEQLCGAFHESMHKFMIEMERKAQLGGTVSIPDVVDVDLDNALHSICDVVSNFVKMNPSSWALLICEMDGINGKMDGINGKMDGINGKMDGINGKMDGINGKMDGINGKMDGINGKMDGINGKMDGINGKMDGINGKMDGINGKMDGINGKMME